MIGFLFFLALQLISRKTEGRVNLRYVQVVYRIKMDVVHSLDHAIVSYKKSNIHKGLSLAFS